VIGVRERVVVIGAGVAGSAAAWRLAERGADVVLVDRFGVGHDRGASHGSSRIFRHAYSNVHYVRLAARALLDRLAGSHEPDGIHLIKPEMRIRQSTSPCIPRK
jgi:glycine/D-amino acid oxidase-like deaminating enzyme